MQAQQTLTSTGTTQNKSDLANLTSIDLVSSISSYGADAELAASRADGVFPDSETVALFNYLSG